MRRLVGLIALLLGLSLGAFGQGLVSGNKGTITQGGNDATVDAGGALKINLGEIGGTAQSGANVIDTGNTAIRVNVVAGSAGGTAMADGGAFTQGTTNFTPVGGEFTTTVTNLTTGQAGAVRLTNDRMMFVNLGDVGGAAIALGQTTMASSVPVAIASNQSNLTVVGSGNFNVVGTQASNSAVGNGLEAFIGRFDSTPPTLTTGDVGMADLDSTGHLIAVGQGVAGTPAGGVVSVQGVASGTALPISGNVGVLAGTALIGAISPNWGCGTTAFNQALVAVPTAATAATATTTCLSAATACNTNASAQTFTLEDNQGTPIIAVNAASIPALSCYTYPFYGAKFTSGIKWLAGGTGVTGALIGVQ